MLLSIIELIPSGFEVFDIDIGFDIIYFTFLILDILEIKAFVVKNNRFYIILGQQCQEKLLFCILHKFKG